jgi:hypothetical protein
MAGRASPATLVVMTTTSLDMGLVERFAGQVFDYYAGGVIAYMIDVGHRTGLSRPPPRARGRRRNSPNAPDCRSATSASGSGR